MSEKFLHVFFFFQTTLRHRIAVSVMEIVLWISRFAFRYVKEFTGSNPWSYKPEQILFDCRKKLPVRLVSTEACGLCSFQCSSVLLQNFLRLLGEGLPAARGQWAPPQQKNRWCTFALLLRPHEVFLQPPWNLCRSLFLGSCVVCHWTYSYSRTSGLGWLSTK